jgi:outer membrane phospholipase A
MIISRLLRFLLLPALLSGLPTASHAELVLRLGNTQAAPGTAIELQGLLVNDTGNPLASPIPTALAGQWMDSQGHVTPAQFQLRTSADTADLPANTFTKMVWTSTVPADAQGLITLTVNGADNSLLALQVGDGGTTIARGTGLSPKTTPAGESLAESPLTAAPTQETAALSPFETFRNALSPYEPMYFALGNKDGANARFQFSFKYRPFSPTDPAHPGFMDNWYFGYTQTSLWDLHSDSIPFVDTTYNPSLFWARESLWDSPDKRWTFGLNTGVEHKSNGKEGEDSRSLNDLYVQPEVSYRLGSGSRISFMPRIKQYFVTDRDMGYQDYLGYVDWKMRYEQDNGLALSGLYRQGSEGHATQLEAAWPLQRTFLHMNGYLYLQYFQGYGETLLGYMQKSDPQVRIGIALVP